MFFFFAFLYKINIFHNRKILTEMHWFNEFLSKLKIDRVSIKLELSLRSAHPQHEPNQIPQDFLWFSLLRRVLANKF